MRLVVLGATGRTGRLVVERALARRLDVTAVLRKEPEVPLDDRASSTVVDLPDPVAKALVGADAVVSAIGPVAETTTEVSEAMRTVVEAMRHVSVRRIVAAANGRVFTDEEVTGEYANVTAEHRRDAAILRESGLDWTILAPPFLKDDPPTGDVVTVIDAKGPGRSLTRGDFASALIDAIDRDEWIGHVVGITNR
jgi:putative NADH-flavin reductase